jgi:hypothetical protein
MLVCGMTVRRRDFQAHYAQAYVPAAVTAFVPGMISVTVADSSVHAVWMFNMEYEHHEQTPYWMC